jgi:carbonic anhydrase
MINDLLEGYHRFKENFFLENADKLRKLAKHQAPKIAMIACCDSRVDPTILFDTSPGDIFLIRNVANLVPAYSLDGHYYDTSAALEFAINVLAVENVVILGHANCGGIQELLERTSIDEQGFIDHWMDIAEPAKNIMLNNFGNENTEEQTRRLAQISIQHSLENLMTFPRFSKRISSGSLQCYGLYYDLNVGTIYLLDPVSKKFNISE